MYKDRSNAGRFREERGVPLVANVYAFSLKCDAEPRRIDLCGTVCGLLGVPHDKPVCRGILN
ncbi:hypothetical protein EWW49_34350 [Pseudomonas syringae]|nr:hypothetical protein EWW49_34350 [Pseudomonas syringae]